MQTNLKEILNTPNEFLEDITEREFFNALDGKETTATETSTPPKKEQPFAEFDFSRETSEQSGPINDNAQGTNVNIKDIISGDLATDLMNRILPVILTIAANKYMDLEVSKKQFELNAAEKNIISPIMEKCLASLNINFENPYIALAMSLSFIYGGKFIEVANNPEFVKAKTKVNQTANKVYSNPAGLNVNGKPLTRKEGETRGRKAKNV